MDMAVPLITLLLMMTCCYISDGALLKRSTAVEFLRPSAREKRSTLECLLGDCSSEENESEELPEMNYEESSKMQYDRGDDQVIHSIPGIEVKDDDGGSGM